MKSLTILLNAQSISYKLPDNLYGTDWINFKNDYLFHIQKAITEGRTAGKLSVTIDIDKLPVLSNDLKALKSFMNLTPGEKYSIVQWNQRRDEAKNFFTQPCISEMDASDYIKQFVK
jgi:hypothetical protein